MIIIEGPLTQKVEKYIRKKSWDKIEELLDSPALQAYQCDKIATIGMMLLYALKERDEKRENFTVIGNIYENPELRKNK